MKALLAGASGQRGSGVAGPETGAWAGLYALVRC